jgi:phytanoyl-CoA hydroxylase
MLAEFKFGDLQGSNEAHDRDGVFIVRDVLGLDFVGELNRHIDWLIERNPGDISVHHPHTVHGSDANISDRWRCGGSIQCMPATTRVTKPWSCTFLFRGEAAEDVINDYKRKPTYIAGERMPFKGCESWK